MIKRINSKEQLTKFLFLYRTPLHIKTIFTSSLKDPDVQVIIKALNEKKKIKRIEYVIEEACKYIDNYYQNANLCHFRNCQCLCHRSIKKDYKNGCCRKCRFQSNKGCTTKNIACKLFLCSYAKQNVIPLEEKDIPILKVLNPIQRYIIRNNYFSSKEEIVKDVYYGLLISGARIEYRLIKMYYFNKKRKKYDQE